MLATRHIKMTQSCCSQVMGCYLVKPTEFGPSLLILKRDNSGIDGLNVKCYSNIGKILI